MNGNILYKIRGATAMKKIDVNFKIFYGSIFFSMLCFSELLRRLMNLDIDALSYLKIVAVVSCITSLILSGIFVENDSVGLENGKYGLIIVISSLIFLLMFIGRL